MKQRRSTYFLKYQLDPDSFGLHKLDLESLVEWFKDALDYKPFVDRILRLHVHPNGHYIPFRLQDITDPLPGIEDFDYEMPSRGMLVFSETIYFFENCFSSLPFDKFYYVLTCLLLEKTVIFVSDSIQRLTSSV